jgi:predicted dehydrogenase
MKKPKSTERDALWLVGAGRMARDYAAVLDDLEVSYEVIGRGKSSADGFEKETGRKVRQGGVRQMLAKAIAPDSAIVAVGVEELADTVVTLVEGGVQRLLVEKPGAIDSTELSAVFAAAERLGADVVVGYNRRYYAACEMARRMIAEDGGVVSCTFELSEWPHATEPVEVAPAVRRRWMVAHSSHVIDLAFHLIGRPVDWSAWSTGSLGWHSGAARFAGAGITDRGATFAYHGDWAAPGRWGLELLTNRRRLTFRPIEKLSVTRLGSLESEEVDTYDDLDTAFKPGLWVQTSSFLDGDRSHACTLADQVEMMPVIEKMAGYR